MDVLVEQRRHGRKARARSGRSAGSRPPRPPARSTGSGRTPSRPCARRRSRRSAGWAARWRPAPSRRAARSRRRRCAPRRSTRPAGCSSQTGRRPCWRCCEHDPSPRVRERAALATGLLRVPGGEAALLAVCHRPEPLAVRAAAALATGAFEQESIVARVVEMRDEAAVRGAPARAPQGRCRVPAARRASSRPRATSSFARSARQTTRAPERSLAEGMRSILDAGERIRLISGLRAFQGEQSRGALLQVIRGDPSPEVRTAALTAVGGLLDERRTARGGAPRAGRPEPAGPPGGGRPLRPDRARSAGCRACSRPCAPTTTPRCSPSVAELAEAAFHTFVDLALGMPLDGPGGGAGGAGGRATSTTPICRGCCR